ncbi:MAG: TldD/PmbA family protein [Bacteriovoracaceae bacterium]|jgi:PmbA protein|nr:TldD/PmbA family protein [Bacteriovoracaceae bacterium]
MEDLQSIGKNTIEKLRELGADKSQVVINFSEMDELTYENDDFTLFRSIDDARVSITVLKDHKKGSISINKLSDDELEEACKKVMEIASSGKADEAFDIAEKAEAKVFDSGPLKADLDNMHTLLNGLVTNCHERYPTVHIRTGVTSFTNNKSLFLNSNGVNFETRKGYYSLNTVFCAQKDGKTSSMNYEGISFQNIPKRAIEAGIFDMLFSQTSEQLDCQKIKETFKGKIILTPACFGNFLSMYFEHLRSTRIISDTSKLYGKLGEKIASEQLTVKSLPCSDKFEIPSFITGEGNEMRDMTILDKGVLENYLMGIYGANKSGHDKVTNFDSRIYIEPGKEDLEKMISHIDHGILVSRFSGGRPSTSGEFSGIAKNSYLIENGKITTPLHETMISGNLFSLFENIWGVSSNTYESGTSIIPWVGSEGVTVS